MKSSRLFAVVTLFSISAASAAQLDMSDPRRSVGREDDIRIDALLLDDTVSSGSTVGVTVQIQNLTSHPIAVADKVCSTSYDPDSQTITLSIGSEVPSNGMLPRMVTIEPGKKRVFSTGAMFTIATAGIRTPFNAAPRFVQIKVSVLRDLVPFRALIQKQLQSPHPVALSDELFDKWLESNDSIFLNSVPVRFDNSRNRRNGAADAERHSMFGSP